MLMVLLAAWLLLGLPVAVVVGRSIALGSRSAELTVPYPPAVTQPRQRDSAVLERSA